MVFANDKKYACESCIKGHRSSSCSHTDRPLFEIKKKGRPVSQCDKCRELRKTKRVHSKCDCSMSRSEKSNVKQLAGKSKRYISILPSLPNGLKDAYTQDQTDLNAANAKGKNRPHQCGCTDESNCGCLSTSAGRGTGLEALARAAALCCSTDESAISPDPVFHDTPLTSAPTPDTSSCCHNSTVTLISHKRRRRSSTASSSSGQSKRGPVLPPLLLPPTSYSAAPEFPTIPPLSTIASLAGTGCTCGLDCTCPGCLEHRGAEHASVAHADCSECSTCVDSQYGLELPLPTAYGSASVSVASAPPMNFIDTFFARVAATIPPPPMSRASASAASFDPMNVTVYPPSLFFGEGSRLGEQGPAFGLVRLPKLECCSGKCGCPGDTCGCGQDCNGCCAMHEASAINAAEPGVVARRNVTSTCHSLA